MPTSPAVASPEDPAPGDADPGETPAPDPRSTVSGWGRLRWPLWVLLGSAVAVGLALRFVTTSPMWLDEALSVNIARLPVGDIGEALRRDGHPPLYYLLLHGWMAVFGEGTTAVRAFSGLWSVAALPLVWLAARRLGGRRVALYAVALVALSPYAIRYGTETRMYAMVSVLVLAAWLVGTDALRRPTPARLAALAGLVAALVWTHYWAIWFLAAIGPLLLWRVHLARRGGRSPDAAATVRVLVAVVVGALTLLPWLPTMLYQGSHTGTPWARPARPTEMVTFTLADLGGGPEAEAIVLGWVVALLAATGVFGHAVGRRTLELDLHTRATTRPYAAVVAGTMAVACVVGYATGAAYASRYFSILFPFLVLLAAVGLDQFRSRPLAFGLVASLLLLGGIGAYRNVVKDRTDADASAEAIESRGGSGDVVVYCPDQLGPSTSRVLEGGFEQVTYPRFGPPERVDWVDYKERLDDTSPEAFAEELLDRAGDRRIFLVYSTSYQTHEELCPALHDAISVTRVPEVLTTATDAYEPAGVVVFESAPR